jgi:hypothetical protein
MPYAKNLQSKAEFAANIYHLSPCLVAAESRVGVLPPVELGKYWWRPTKLRFVPALASGVQWPAAFAAELRQGLLAAWPDLWAWLPAQNTPSQSLVRTVEYRRTRALAADPGADYEPGPSCVEIPFRDGPKLAVAAALIELLAVPGPIQILDNPSHWRVLDRPELQCAELQIRARLRHGVRWNERLLADNEVAEFTVKELGTLLTDGRIGEVLFSKSESAATPATAHR